MRESGVWAAPLASRPTLWLRFHRIAWWIRRSSGLWHSPRLLVLPPDRNGWLEFQSALPLLEGDQHNDGKTRDSAVDRSIVELVIMMSAVEGKKVAIVGGGPGGLT